MISARALEFAVHPAFAERARGTRSRFTRARARPARRSRERAPGPTRRSASNCPASRMRFYLKRQHVVTRRERFRNWRAGFGWVSRCERERSLLEQLARARLTAPRWVAAGEDARGRAFLLVEEIEDAPDLRHALQSAESPVERARLAGRIGSLIDDLHRHGFTTPDLTAKHLLVSDDAVIPIDWQNARRAAQVERRRSRPRAGRTPCLDPAWPCVAAGTSPRSSRGAAIRADRWDRHASDSPPWRGESPLRQTRLGTRRSIRDQHRADSSSPAPRLGRR